MDSQDNSSPPYKSWLTQQPAKLLKIDSRNKTLENHYKVCLELHCSVCQSYLLNLVVSQLKEGK